MPANLTHKYRRAEQAYREAQTPAEELSCLEVMLRDVPKHKGTDKLQADLKSRIAKLKRGLQQESQGRRAPSFKIPRQGAGRAVLLGAPNSGKSRLLQALTRAEPEVAPYPFTTREPAPAMMAFEDVRLQLIDTPPITADYLDPGVQALIRGADAILLLVDLSRDEGIDELDELLAKLDETKTRLAEQSSLSETDIGVSYTATLLVANQVDRPGAATRLERLGNAEHPTLPVIPVSAESGDGLDPLKAKLYELLDIVRVYTKAPNRKEADFEKPFTLRRGGTLLDVAELIHEDLAKRFRFARVWGEGSHDGAVMKADYVVNDRDIVEIHA